jgi:hypothetical protein
VTSRKRLERVSGAFDAPLSEAVRRSVQVLDVVVRMCGPAVVPDDDSDPKIKRSQISIPPRTRQILGETTARIGFDSDAETVRRAVALTEQLQLSRQNRQPHRVTLPDGAVMVLDPVLILA